MEAAAMLTSALQLPRNAKRARIRPNTKTVRPRWKV